MSSSDVLEKQRMSKILQLREELKTNIEIGKILGISRERVRQILKKHGLTNSNSPRIKEKAIIRASNKEFTLKSREEKIKKIHGMSLSEFKKIRGIKCNNGTTAYDGFVLQKKNAKHAGHIWELTFDQWWGVWRESGKYAQRGRASHEYVLASIEKEWGYIPGNVRIIKFGENIRQLRSIK